MRIAIVGAGAIGCYLGARLAVAGETCTFIARGENLKAIRAAGVRLVLEDGSELLAREVRAFERMAEAGAHDVVLLGVKAHQVASVAADLERLCGDETAIVTLQNGIPWWYFYRSGGPFDGRSVRHVDPDDVAGKNIDPRRVIGCVVYPAAELVAPGVVKVIEGNRFTLGEPDGALTARVQALSANLTRAGFKAPVVRDIRSEIWLKLWGALSFNPISALTHSTLVSICEFSPTRALVTEMMREAQVVAEKLGVRFRIPIENRIAGAQRVGAHKTSMLQDVEQGRSLELEAILGAVFELAQMTETPAPHIEAVYACASLLAKTLAEGQGRLRVQPRSGGGPP
jgi:2-dehydropantoate 2-reductase